MPSCEVGLHHQYSRLGCIAGESYGCAPGGRLQTAADSKRQQNPNDSAVWVEQSCRGPFMCGTGSHPVMCGKPGQDGVGRRFLCRCDANRTLKPVDFGVSPITSAAGHGVYAGTTSDSASAFPFARPGGSPAGARPCSPVGAGSVDSVQARTGYLPTSVIGPSSGVLRTPSDGEAVDAGKIISLSDDQTLRRRRHAGQRTACRTRTAWPARTAPPRADSAPCRTARHRPTQRGARPLRRRT